MQVKGIVLLNIACMCVLIYKVECEFLLDESEENLTNSNFKKSEFFSTVRKIFVSFVHIYNT